VSRKERKRGRLAKTPSSNPFTLSSSLSPTEQRPRRERALSHASQRLEKAPEELFRGKSGKKELSLSLSCKLKITAVTTAGM